MPIILLIVFLVGCYFFMPRKVYDAAHFGIEVVTSPVDYNHNSIDDYTDILLGAKEEALNHSKYRSAYYAGGYPPKDEGVCTDVIWRALEKAGYLLKDLVDEDIQNNIDSYPRVDGKPDPNIDFRRVPNLQVYFKRHTISLTLNLKRIEEWQPGDIVIFGNNHIAIISDKRNKKGIPYIIHNANQPKREEDTLVKWNRHSKITGHYRFLLS